MVSLLPCTAADYPLFAELFPLLETGDQTPALDRFVRDLLPETRVLRLAGQAVGYLNTQVLDGVGYVRQIVVRPHERRRGLARQALLRFAAELRDAGCRRWCLNVKPENLAAVRLYTALGMGREYGSVALRIGWTEALGLPRPEEPAVVEVIQPAHDQSLESSFALERGMLAAARVAGKVLRSVRTPAGEGQALAVFDPHFPGAFPFRVRTKDLCRPLLAALREQERTGGPEVHVVIEGDDPLADFLLAHGAILKMRFEHYGGPLPARQPT